MGDREETDRLTTCAASIRYEGESYNGLPPYACALPAGHEDAHSDGAHVAWTATETVH